MLLLQDNAFCQKRRLERRRMHGQGQEFQWHCNLPTTPVWPSYYLQGISGIQRGTLHGICVECGAPPNALRSPCNIQSEKYTKPLHWINNQKDNGNLFMRNSPRGYRSFWRNTPNLKWMPEDIPVHSLFWDGKVIRKNMEEKDRSEILYPDVGALFGCDGVVSAKFNHVMRLTWSTTLGRAESLPRKRLCANKRHENVDSCLACRMIVLMSVVCLYIV